MPSYNILTIYENENGVPLRAVVNNRTSVNFSATDTDNEYYAEYNDKIGIFKTPDGKYECQLLETMSWYKPFQTINIVREKKTTE